MRSVAGQPGGAAAEAKQRAGGAGQAPEVGQPADVEGPPSSVSYDGGPASAKDAGDAVAARGAPVHHARPCGGQVRQGPRT